MNSWKDKYDCSGDFYNRTSRQELAATLEAVRRTVCAYMGDRCDCKYGLKPGDTRFEYVQASSEQTGCPELAEVIDRLLHHPESFMETDAILFR